MSIPTEAILLLFLRREVIRLWRETGVCEPIPFLEIKRGTIVLGFHKESLEEGPLTMKRPLIIKGALLGIGLVTGIFAEPAAETRAMPADKAEVGQRTICQLCGMDAAKSDTEFILVLKTEPEMHACCISCAHRMMKKLGAEVKQVTALDYQTRKQVPAKDAFYVLGSKRVPQGSMLPFVFAFGAREDADAFKNRYGGEVLTYAEIVIRLEAEKNK